MFKLTQSASFRWPVTVMVPADGGTFAKETFDVEFKRLSQTRLEELKADVLDGKSSDQGICNEVVVGWSGVTDDGDAVPFSDSALTKLLDIPGVAAGIVMSFLDSASGYKRKN